MKQHITHEQFGELSEKAKQIYKKFYNTKGYHGGTITTRSEDGKQLMGMLSIGQMVEFLDERIDITVIKVPDGFNVGIVRQDPFEHLYYHNEELCDALWEAVKQVLENET